MHLYTADCRENAQNTLYPNEIEINNIDDMQRAMLWDHMAGKMQDSYRNSSNFQQCDVLAFDVDNTHSNDPETWKTQDDITDALPVAMYIVRSRNYMKPKKKVNKAGQITYEEPREKWHVYALLRHAITDPAVFEQTMLAVMALFPYLDPAAIDNAHCLFGVEAPHVDYIEGEFLDDFLEAEGRAALRAQQKAALDEFIAGMKSGAYKANKANNGIVEKLCAFLGVSNPLTGKAAPANTANDAAPASDPGDGRPSWIYFYERDDRIRWLEQWAKKHDVTLGKRYELPATDKNHPEGMAVCVTCPWEEEHSGGNWPENEAVIIVDLDGKLNYLCRHGHGGGIGWKDYRAKVESDYNKAHAQDQPAETTTQTPQENTAQAPFKPDNVATYIDSMMGDEIERFGVEVKTGFSGLDAEIGGLYAGLYVVGAISSLGKTTFCHQMADQIAAAGHDVLFFSLEQSRLEMVSKSLARITAQKNLADYVTSLAIRKGYLSAVVKEAAAQYKNSVADRMSIIEGDFESSISFISEYIRRYMNRNQCRPVVFIDYLQILQPVESEKKQYQTVREVVDNGVKQMKLLSRELSIPIVTISSLNRNNYLTPVDFESFKESGGIEYTADVIWGLQLAVMNDSVFDSATKIKEKREKVKEAKRKTPREVELVCLKNRFGKPSFYVPFDYYPAADLFKESGGQLPAPKASGKLKRR